MTNPYQQALQQPTRFWQLQFAPALEREFMQYRLQYYIPRIRILALTAIAMILLYSYMDYTQFSGDILMQTILVRLGLDLPLILLVLVASYRFTSARRFYWLFGFAYLVNGLSILFILVISHLNGIDLPYEGLFLWLMFGYFLFGLPMLYGTLSSMLVSGGYVLGEYWIGAAQQEIFYAAFFLTSANIVGAVGSFLLERLSRTNFLYLSQARLNHEIALTDVNNRTRFIAAASHDLRQPIHAIGLMIDRLSRHPNEAAITTPRLQQAHEQLNDMLSSLLDISRLDMGLVTPTLDDVQLSRLMAVIPSTDIIHVDVADDLWVRSDNTLLSRIVGNLVTNALRHAQATRIEIAAHRHGDQIRLTVKDNGVGMDAQTQKIIFSAYARGNHDQQGLGLGLAIVKELCALLALPLTLTSSPNAGCEFSLLIPQGQAKQPIGKSAAPRRILLLEDNEQQRAYLSTLLTDWGHEVVTPSSLASVDESLQHDPALSAVDLVMADFELGANTTGLKWIRDLRQHAPELPALLMSASTDAELPARCREQRVGFLPKPVTPVAIRIWLERH